MQTAKVVTSVGTPKHEERSHRASQSLNEAAVDLQPDEIKAHIRVVSPARSSLTYERHE